MVEFLVDNQNQKKLCVVLDGSQKHSLSVDDGNQNIRPFNGSDRQYSLKRFETQKSGFAQRNKSLREDKKRIEKGKTRQNRAIQKRAIQKRQYRKGQTKKKRGLIKSEQNIMKRHRTE